MLNRPRRLPARLPLVLFAVLALATVGAFYLTQHLKVLNPLVNGEPRTDPPVIDPRYAGTCPNLNGTPVSYRVTKLGFYLQSKSDVVVVSVLDADGATVAQMRGSGRYIVARNNNYAFFTWNGRLADGRPAPAGTYTFLVALLHEDRSFALPGVSVRVLEDRPVPRVLAVAPTHPTGSGTALAPLFGGATYLSPGHGDARLTLSTGPSPRRVRILVYRASPSSTHPLQLMTSFLTDPGSSTATWNGRIDGRPAPAGSYLLGVQVTDAACTRGTFPAIADPVPGTTQGAGVQVSAISAEPPPTPTPAGGLAAVTVLDGNVPFSWALRRGTDPKVIFHGPNTGTGRQLVRLPDVGLYSLSLDADGHRTAVPLVASARGPRAGAPVLVVLPALTWQGTNPTTDGDGLIDTLTSAPTINLDRPFVAGLPPGYSDEAALLSYLQSAHLPYDLTTDVALAEHLGPTLSGRHGLLLDGTFTWLPNGLGARFAAFVRAGGGAFASGLRSLVHVATLADGTAGPQAGPVKATARDPFGVAHGAISPTGGELITSLTDSLGIFADAPALQFPGYQVLTPPGGRVASAAGVATSAPAVIGFRLGHGTVVEAGLPDFGASLRNQVDSQELLSRIWRNVLR